MASSRGDLQKDAGSQEQSVAGALQICSNLFFLFRLYRLNWFRAAEINEKRNDQSDIPEIPSLRAKCMAATLRQVMRLSQISS